MHCLGAGVANGQTSPGGVGSHGGAVSVVRALGVLVCEGRIQGPPRGYKEGPHCVPSLQSAPSNHICDTDNYLCDRYVILVREIANRIAAGSYLCVEVLLCSDCPCGLAKARCKDPVYSVTDSWQHSSEMLLEYWCIGVVPSKHQTMLRTKVKSFCISIRSQETMNSQGLYQAVRSRLHFSQVAAWWSRSSGVNPNYIATRVVSYNEDIPRKFLETPIEHTFPLVSSGDGNSVKVTVWALPRMEEVPILSCPIHFPKEDEIGVARALTPTKSISSSVAAHTSDSLVLPVLLDDRLQPPCNKPGKHHCRCEEEDGCPPSPSIRSTGERKRRRSLPCGPAETSSPGTVMHSSQLPQVQENCTRETKECRQNVRTDQEKKPGSESSINFDILENCFRAQLSIEEQEEGNIEKRYKLSSETTERNRNNETATSMNFAYPGIHVAYKPGSRNIENANRQKLPKLVATKSEPFGERSPFHETNPGPSSQENMLNCTVHCTKNKAVQEEQFSGQYKPLIPGKDISQLMSKLTFPENKDKAKEEGGILEWFTRVPGRVLSNVILDEDKSMIIDKTQGRSTNTMKMKNCNLELSQREFDEVLAVLRARTPSGKRRVPFRGGLKRRERCERSTEVKKANVDESYSCESQNCEARMADKSDWAESRNCNEAIHMRMAKVLKKEEPKVGLYNVANKADVLLGAILRTSNDRNKLQNDSIDEPNDVKSSTASTESCVLEGDKFLPSVLNKRLHRLKQLFKRDQEKTLEEDLERLTNNNTCAKTRQKIEFQAEELSAGTSTNSAHSDSISKPHSTNVADDSSEDDKTSMDGKEVETDEEREDSTDKTIVPSVIEQERFRRSLENAASMVFHSRTGLPLTSSPAPLRRGSCCFDFDSSLNTASSKRSALFELNTPPSPGAVSLEETDKEAENVCDSEDIVRRRSSSRIRPTSHALLGSFEESALNGRLEPVSTVHGFTAEIGASGSFCPKHRKLPVTVFFYTLGDNDKISSPYLAHINLGKKGYQVPRSGTIQVTLLNPLGTVVKMFVVLYDLSDMPPRSHTFLRQRTLRDKTLRYLIHLRFMSGKSGRIYLHTDIRMIICRKSDVDTASDFASEPPKEVRSYLHGPTNPKFSPRC